MTRDHPIPELRGLPDDERMHLFRECAPRVWRYRAFWIGGFAGSAVQSAERWACANLPPGLLSDAVAVAVHVLWLHVFGFGFVWALRGAIRDRKKQDGSNESQGVRP